MNNNNDRWTPGLPWMLVALLAATSVFLFATRHGGTSPADAPATDLRPVPSATVSSLSKSRTPGSQELAAQADALAADAADFDTLLNEPPGRERRRALLAAVRVMAEEDPVAALKRVEEELEGQDLASSIRVGLMVWITQDPHAAGEWVLAMRRDPSFESTLAAFASDWGRIDPLSASKWLATLPADEANESAADALAKRWAKEDALAAYDWSLQHYAQTEVGIAFQRALGELAKGDPAVAVEALSRAPADLQYRGHSQLAAVWADDDFTTAAGWASALPDDRNRGAALSSVLDVWSRETPSEAAQFLVELGEFPGQANAAAVVIGNWADNDPAKASEWLATLPGGELRDEAITGFTYTLGYTDPASALAWGLDIGQPELRAARVEEMLADWHDRDPAEARAWMEQTPELPETIKSHVLQL